MKKLTMAEAHTFLAELLLIPEGAPAVLMRGKKPIAVILPVGDADFETVSLSFDPTFNAIIQRSRRSAELGRSYSSEEIRQLFNLPPFDPERARANGRRSKPKAVKSAAVRKTKVKK